MYRYSKKTLLLCSLFILILTLSVCLISCNRNGNEDGNEKNTIEWYTHPSTDAPTSTPTEKTTDAPTEQPTQIHTHTEVTIPAVDPTCSKTGLSSGKKCSECGEIILAQTELAKLPHTPVSVLGIQPTCSETGLTEGKVCSVCDEVLMPQEEIEKLPHTVIDIPEIAPTCTEAGVSTGKQCSVCEQFTVTPVVLEATGHREEYIEGTTPTCTETGLTSGKKCSECGEWTQEQSKIDAMGHMPKTIPGYGASCTETGLTDGSVCLVCDAVLTEQTEISSLGHDMGMVYASDADNHWQVCTRCNAPSEANPHFYSGTACSVCGHGCEHSDRYWEPYIQPTCSSAGMELEKCRICGTTTNTRAVEALPHTLGDGATCTTAQTCTECGYVAVAALGHTKGDEATCTTPQKCTVCQQTLAAATGHTPSDAATCETPQTCTKCNTVLVAAKGHILGAPATCDTSQTCTVCGHIEKAALGHTAGTPATCTTAQRCRVCDEILTPALGHSYNIDNVTCTENKYCTVCEKVIEKSAGHTPSGAASCTASQVCLVCDEILVAALGHSIVTDEAVEPTCTTAGVTEGKHCSRCDTVMLAQMPLAAMGHDYVYSRCSVCADMIKAEDVDKAVMPRLDINTSGAAIDSKEIYTPALVTLSDCDEEFTFADISAGIRIRGNSTAVVPKKPYRLKFDVKRNMLGLNNGKKFKSWVLMADYYDSSMLRTFSTFSMAKILNEGKYFSSDFTPVEVYINGEYQGVYLLCEQSQIDGNRVDIYEREDTDTSLEIGYLLIGQGGRTDEPNTVTIGTTLTATDRNGIVNVAGGGNYSISGGDYTPEQIAYVKRYVEGVYEVIRRAVYEDAYYSLDREGNLTKKTDFVGITKQARQIETIDAVFNIDACVRLCLLDEIVKNLDAGTYNMYVDLSPTGDGRLTLGPPWDFDFALANTGYASTHSPTGYYATNYTYSDGMRVNTTFVFFGNLPWFEKMVCEMWEEHVDELYAVANNLSVMTAMYGEQYQRDYAHWNRGLMGHHCQTCHAGFTCHADTVDFLSSWLYKRLDWLDYVWGDGEPPAAAEQSPLMLFDFTDESVTDYLTGFRRCHGTVTAQGYKVELDEAYDPYFTLDISKLPESFDAQDYPFIEIEYMLPVTNSYSTYNTFEIFLCAGQTTGATGGISVADYLVYPDGVYHKVRFDLTDSPMWQGQIHSIRIDPMGACELSDVMYIKSIKFLTE